MQKKLEKVLEALLKVRKRLNDVQEMIYKGKVDKAKLNSFNRAINAFVKRIGELEDHGKV